MQFGRRAAWRDVAFDGVERGGGKTELRLLPVDIREAELLNDVDVDDDDWMACILQIKSPSEESSP